MRHLLVLAFGVAAWVLPVTAGHLPQAIGTAEISGRVTTEEIPAVPVSRARVTLTNVANGMASIWSMTGDDGTFRISAVPSGRFVVSASKPSYVSVSYGASRPSLPGVTIDLAGGQRLSNVALTLMRGAVITGRIVDAAAQPVPDVVVNVLRLETATQSQNSRLVRKARAQSDDLGEYRAYGLEPGEYTVVALPRTPSDFATRPILPTDVERGRAALAQPGLSLTDLGLPSPRSFEGQRVGYAPVFVPNILDGAAAGTIRLAAGEQRSGVDVTVQFVHVAQVEGTVTTPSGASADSVQVSLTSTIQQIASSQDIGGQFVSTVQNGRYWFGGVPPGKYSLLARWRPGAGASAEGRSAGDQGSETLWASSEVNVSGDDLNLPLVMQRSSAVAGRIFFEGPRPTKKDLESWRLALDPIDGGPEPAIPIVAVGEAGEFTVEGAAPGTYRPVLHAAAASEKWSLESAVYDGQEAADLGISIRVGSDQKSLNLTFTNQPTVVSGVLKDRHGEPIPNYVILIFSVDRSKWALPSRWVREAVTDREGHYSIVGLPSGDYREAAISDADYRDSVALSRLSSLEASATTLRLARGQKMERNFEIQ